MLNRRNLLLISAISSLISVLNPHGASAQTAEKDEVRAAIQPYMAFIEVSGQAIVGEEIRNCAVKGSGVLLRGRTVLTARHIFTQKLCHEQASDELLQNLSIKVVLNNANPFDDAAPPIDDAVKIRAQLHRAQTDETTQAARRQDVALLRLEDKPATPLRAVGAQHCQDTDLAFQNPPDKSIFLAGYKAPIGLSIETGSVTNPNIAPTQQAWAFSAEALEKGMSGGPVLRLSNDQKTFRVIGFARSLDSNAHSVKYMTPMTLLAVLLQEVQLYPETCLRLDGEAANAVLAPSTDNVSARVEVFTERDKEQRASLYPVLNRSIPGFASYLTDDFYFEQVTPVPDTERGWSIPSMLREEYFDTQRDIQLSVPGADEYVFAYGVPMLNRTSAFGALKGKLFENAVKVCLKRTGELNSSSDIKLRCVEEADQRICTKESMQDGFDEISIAECISLWSNALDTASIAQSPKAGASADKIATIASPAEDAMAIKTSDVAEDSDGDFEHRRLTITSKTPRFSDLIDVIAARGWAIPTFEGVCREFYEKGEAFTSVEFSFDPFSAIDFRNTLPTEYSVSYYLNDEALNIGGVRSGLIRRPIFQNKEARFVTEQIAIPALNFTGEFGGFDKLTVVIDLYDEGGYAGRKTIVRPISFMRSDDEPITNETPVPDLPNAPPIYGDLEFSSTARAVWDDVFETSPMRESILVASGSLSYVEDQRDFINSREPTLYVPSQTQIEAFADQDASGRRARIRWERFSIEAGRQYKVKTVLIDPRFRVDGRCRDNFSIKLDCSSPNYFLALGIERENGVIQTLFHSQEGDYILEPWAKDKISRTSARYKWDPEQNFSPEEVGCKAPDSNGERY